MTAPGRPGIAKGTKLPKQSRKRLFIPQPKRGAAAPSIDADCFLLLDALDDNQYLTAKAAQLLLNPSSTAGGNRMVHTRLRRLFDQGLSKRTVPRSELTIRFQPGSKPMIHSITRKGADALVEWLNTIDDETRPARFRGRGVVHPSDLRWRKGDQTRLQNKMVHELAISEFRTALVASVRGSDGLLIDWQQGKLDPKTNREISLVAPVYVTLPHPRNKKISKQKFHPYPDAYFNLHHQHYYLELDNKSEEGTGNKPKRPYLEKKYRNYWWLLQSKDFLGSKPNHENARVVFITTGGERRLASMMNLLREMPKPNNPKLGGKGKFLFACTSDYSVDDPKSVLAPIFRTVTRGGPQSLDRLAA